MTPYSAIDTMFLNDITDDTFLDYEEDERNLILDNLRIKAIVRFKACKKDLSNRDEVLKQFNVDLTEEEQLIIATIMRKYWLNDKIYNLDLLKQRMSNKDWKLTSQAEHLKNLILLKKNLDEEISQKIVDYTVYSYKLEE